MNENIRGLSWRQPFASLMLHGKIETRTWKTNYRGWVLICASKKSYTSDELYYICGGQYQYRRIIDVLGYDPSQFDDLYGRCDPPKFDDNCGQAISVGKLVDCRPMKKEDEDDCFVSYSPNLWCHIYKDVKEIKPFPFKGKQGWSKLDKETFDKIEYINYGKEIK